MTGDDSTFSLLMSKHPNEAQSAIVGADGAAAPERSGMWQPKPRFRPNKLRQRLW